MRNENLEPEYVTTCQKCREDFTFIRRDVREEVRKKFGEPRRTHVKCPRCGTWVEANLPPAD